MPINNLVAMLVAAVITLLSGCASIAGEKTQPITFKTIRDNTEVAGVGCKMTNDAGSWFVTTPGSVTVHKSTGDMAVDCKKEDLFGHETLISKSNGAVWGNILAGGGIGYVIDRNTGAGFNYPDTVTINLDKVGETPKAPQINQQSNNQSPQPTPSSAPQTPEAANIASINPAMSSEATAQKLRELQALRNEGVVTEEEYQTKKKQLLEKM